MQEQNFEKQVQQKMEEFSLTPSVPVWQKVEKEIQQKKKRRRIVFFWLFPFVLVGAGLLWWTTIPSSNESNQVSTINTPNQQPSRNPSINSDKTTINDRQPIEQAERLNHSVKPVKERVTKTDKHERRTSISVASTSSSLPVKTRSQPINTNTKPNELDRTAENETAQADSKPKAFLQQEENRNKPVVKALQDAPQPITNDNLNESNLITGVITDTANVVKKEALTGSNTQPKLQEQQASEPKRDTSAVQKAKKKESKWSFAVQAAFGISSIQSDLLVKASSTPQVRNDFTFSNGVGVTPAGPLAIPSPSAVEKGMSYQFALIAKRTITKSLSSSIGLQYNQFTTINKIGRSISRDTVISIAGFNKAIDGYYQSGPNNQLQNFTNKYHFIELPVAIEWQPLKKLPLRLQAGTNLSYLIASNGLVYDTRARIYYHNKDLFNKLQLHFNSGLTYQVWKRKQWALHAGPFFQYGITNLQKDKVSNNYHLFATGIKTHISF